MEYEIREDFQTRLRGTHDDEYEIYRHAAEELGWEVKTFEEWMNS